MLWWIDQVDSIPRTQWRPAIRGTIKITAHIGKSNGGAFGRRYYSIDLLTAATVGPISSFSRVIVFACVVRRRRRKRRRGQGKSVANKTVKEQSELSGSTTAGGRNGVTGLIKRLTGGKKKRRRATRLYPVTEIRLSNVSFSSSPLFLHQKSNCAWVYCVYPAAFKGKAIPLKLAKMRRKEKKLFLQMNSVAWWNCWRLFITRLVHLHYHHHHLDSRRPANEMMPGEGAAALDLAICYS